MLCGPDAIAAIMLRMNEADGLEESLAVLGVVPVIRLLADRVKVMIRRLLGMLLAALAAQYVIDRLSGSLGIWRDRSG